MQPIEIIVIVSSVIFVGLIVGIYIKKLIKGEPTGECACCHKGSKKLIKEYHKKYPSCCCKK